MTDNNAHRHKRQTALRKLSCCKREAQVDAGELDPKLDFICPFCDRIFSLYYGRHKIHLCVCKLQPGQTVKVPKKVPLPPPPLFKSEAFPPFVTTGE